MEQKLLNKKNLIVLAVVVLMIVAVAVASLLVKREINPTLGTLEADPTATVEATQAPEVTVTPEATAVPEATLEPAKAYLVVTVGDAMYEPIPLYQSGRYTIRQGEDLVNVIEVTTDSMKMYESSCDNQDCVEQGLVSLENRADRVLQNMVICLPNQVVLELYTPEEVAQLLLSMAGYTGEETTGEATDE